ncbi:MAG: right-handed parallel beta-helix repeat-containing protein [Planctomycetales bacterium]
MNRRDFLTRTSGLLGAAGLGRLVMAADPPAVTHPRATSGDTAFEPDWDERLTVTVGPQDAQIVGTSDKALQAAVDFVARLGGGTVHVLPGTYKLRNAVYLASHVRILGSGDDSVLIKEPSVKVKLAVDSDWYDQEITLADPQGFQVGDGVCLKTKNPHNGGIDVAKRTLVARSGKRFKLDKALRQNFWEMGESTAATLFPLLSGEFVSDVVIENITLDGNKAHNENLDGNYAGCIFLQDCSRFQIRGVTARNYNGDGLSWQICHDVQVENCHSHDNVGLGMHPGSGSQRPVMRNNRIERNDIGIFFCWGVKFGLAEGNKLDGNRNVGVSIGHRDNNNLVVDNDILNSGKVGVLFRPERGKAFAPHRNRFEGNRIVNSGPEEGVAVDVQGETESIVLARNDIRETRMPMKRIGIRVGAQTRQIELVDNRVEGFATAVQDLRPA